MAKRQKQGNPVIDAAAEAVGRTLGTVAGTIDSLKARHPHPIAEAREAWDAGTEKIAEAVADAGERAATAVEKVRGTVRKTRKAATRARSRGAKAIARATGSAKRAVKRTRKAVARTRKRSLGGTRARRKR